MVGSELNSLSLIQLYNCKSVQNLTQFAGVAQELDTFGLVQKYKELVENAPRRHERGKKYFVGHELFVGGKKKSNRKEEHLAGALFNECQRGKTFLLSDKRKLKFIDYQFPLKAKQKDKGVGKIDLFGLIDDAIPCVIELKVDQRGGAKADTPLRALLEGLTYCAIVEANKKGIWKETQEKFGLKFKGSRPYLMILGTVDYWSYYLNKPSAGNWWSVMDKLILTFKSVRLPITSLISIEDSNFSWATEGRPARFTAKPIFLPVNPKI